MAMSGCSRVWKVLDEVRGHLGGLGVMALGEHGHRDCISAFVSQNNDFIDTLR